MQYLLTQEEIDKLKQSREATLTITLMRSTILNDAKIGCKNWSHQNVEFVQSNHFLTGRPLHERRSVKHLVTCVGCPMVDIYLHITSKFGSNGYVQGKELQRTICPDMEYVDVSS